MIRFACSRCGKRFRKDDSLAGRRGRCSCGNVFRVPGVRVSQPSVFVPADDDPPPMDIPAFVPTVQDDSSINLRSPGKSGSPAGRWIIPFWLAAVAANYLSTSLGDDIKASFPSLNPALLQWASAISMYAFPAVTPVVLSRMGYLSVGRWIIMTVVCFAVWITLAAFFLVLLISGPKLRPMPPNWIAVLAFLTSINSFIGGFGCMVAAAVHPKRANE